MKLHRRLGRLSALTLACGAVATFGIMGAANAAAADGTGSTTYTSPTGSTNTTTPSTITGQPGDWYTVNYTGTPQGLPSTTNDYELTIEAPGLTAADVTPSAGGTCVDATSTFGPPAVTCSWPGTDSSLDGQTFSLSAKITIPAGTGTVGHFYTYSTTQAATPDATVGDIVVPQSTSAPVANPGIAAAVVLLGGAAIGIKRRSARAAA